METHQGFSIREYVSRMRSVNVVKCWPFDEPTNEESVKSLLPPITVKKFVWWLDGLEYCHSESPKNVDKNAKKKKKKKKKNKKVKEKGESSLRSEEDTVKMMKSSKAKAKAKAPKKRSMLEIFSVAPQVERINTDDDDDDEDEEEDVDSVQEENGSCIDSKLSLDEEINWGFKGRRNEKIKKKKKKTNKKKKKKNKEIILSKLNKAKKVIQKIKKQKKKLKRNDKMDLTVSNKENCIIFKLQAQGKAMATPNSSYTRETENSIQDLVSIHNKKPRLHHLNADKKKIIASKAFRLIPHENRQQGNILKNHSKAFSVQQPTMRILPDAVQVTHSGKKKGKKGVAFLQKDNLLRRKPSPPIECLNKQQKYCESDMHNVHHVDGSVGRDSSTVETGGSDRIENETTPCCIFNASTFVKQHNNILEPAAFCRSLTSNGKNQHLFDLKEAYGNNQNIDGITNFPSCMGGRLSEDLATDHGSRFPPVSFKDYLETYNDHSVSHLSNLGKGTNQMFQAINDAHFVQYETFPDFSPSELLQTVCSPPHDGYQRGRKSCISGTNEGGFVGLPLNSQGELITLSSSAKGDFNQMMIKSSAVSASSISSSLPSNDAFSNCFMKLSECRSWDGKDQLNLFPVKEKDQNPIVCVPSRFDNGQRDLDLDLFKINNPENSLRKVDDWFQKSHGNERILSTMRLMGREFIVGGRDFQELGNGHNWRDKQIISEHHFSNTSYSNAMMHDRNDPSLGKLRKTLPVPLETTINHRSGSLFASPHYDCQTSSIHQNGSRKIYPPAEEVYSPATFSGVYNSESLFQTSFPTGYELNLELPHRDIQLPNKQQNLPKNAPISAIRFPFTHPDLEERGVLSPFDCDSSRKGSLMSSSNFQPYDNNLGCSSHPCGIPETNHWTDYSSASTKPEAFHLYNSFPFGSTLKSSIDPPASPSLTLSTQQAPMHCYQIYGNQRKIRNRAKSRIGDRQAKRQPPTVPNVPFEPVKISSLGIKEGSQCSQCATTKSTTFVNFDHVETEKESCSATIESKILSSDVYGSEAINSQWIDWVPPS